ncbi:MAG: hypothetical protein ACI8VC_000632 [Candidatus Endobugula sp.]|jgi:hypothetical protein
MATDQQKSIKKTVWVIVAIMVTILVLFINKITTPRYLSLLELKINGLVLFKKNSQAVIDAVAPSPLWVLLVNSEEETQLLKDVMLLLDDSVKTSIVVVDESTLTDQYQTQSDIQSLTHSTNDIIPIIKPTGEYVGYLVSPYNRNKVILTLSSVVTHR